MTGVFIATIMASFAAVDRSSRRSSRDCWSFWVSSGKAVLCVSAVADVPGVTGSLGAASVGRSACSGVESLVSGGSVRATARRSSDQPRAQRSFTSWSCLTCFRPTQHGLKIMRGAKGLSGLVTITCI